MNLKNINWPVTLFLVGYQVALVVLLPLYLMYRTPSAGLLISAGVLCYITGISVTSGYHRYYAHRSYKPHRVVEPFLLFFSTMAVEGSALEWAHDHRLHHRHADTEKDPYNIKEGFWHAHFFWMLEKQERNFENGSTDLMQNPLVMFQHDYYAWLMVLFNLMTIGAAGWWFGDYFGAFVFVFLGRLFVLHHMTWFINSLAHTWGVRPFSKEQTAVNNFFIAFLTFGEGYHNYHHSFSGDYRNGVYWYQFDPTKYTIWLLSKVGLARDLYTVDEATIQKKILEEDRRMMLNQIEDHEPSKREQLREKIQNLYERLREIIDDLNGEDQESSGILEKRFQVGWRKWTRLCDQTLSV